MLRKCALAVPRARFAQRHCLPRHWQRSWRPCASRAEPCGEAKPAAAERQGRNARFLETPLAQRAFSALNLTTFSESELRSVFNELDRDGSGDLERHEVHEVLREAYVGYLAEAELDAHAEQMTSELFARLDRNKDERISYSEFNTGIRQLAIQRDPRVWPVATSVLLTGIAFGVVIPVMPQLVLHLNLTQAEFGYFISTFGLAKLLANVPAGMVVDSSGRRSAMVGGLAVAGGGMLGIGLAGSLPQLLAARFTTGLGTAAQMAGSTMATFDISTPLNRARTLAPVTMAFSAGSILGPALGGILLETLGLAPTLYVCGGFFVLNALGVRALAVETMPKLPSAAEPVSATLRRIFRQWGPLWRDAGLRTAFVANGAYWLALAGGNMTLLPLMLVGQFGLSPGEMGTVFALQAALAMVAAGPVASLSDRWGSERLLAPSLGLMAASMVALPLAPDMLWAAGPLALMTLSSAVLSSAPLTLVTNLATSESRTQAITLVRCLGDVGWLVGGISVGTAASVIGTGPAMQSAGVVMLASAGWSAVRVARMLRKVQ